MEGCQVESSETGRITKPIDFDDPATPDRKAHNGERLSTWKPRHDSRCPIHDYWFHRLRKVRENMSACLPFGGT